MKEFKIKLDVITDLFIGSGQKVNNFDYLIDDENGKIEIYNFTELLKKSRLDSEKINKVTRFLESRRKGKRYELNFKELANILGVDIRELEKTTFKKSDSFDRSKCSELEMFFDGYNHHFIPGSSLKGAFRTAIENDELSKGEKPTANEFFDKEKLPQIIFRDSSFLSEGFFKIVETFRFMKGRGNHSYKKNFLGMIQAVERDNIIDMSINAKDDETLKNLFKIANEFTLQVLNVKIEVCEKIKNKVNNDDFNEFIENLKELENKVEVAKENECYLFLGKYKGKFENSYAVTEYSKHKDLKEAPKTYCCTENNYPMGLVKLENV